MYRKSLLVPVLLLAVALTTFSVEARDERELEGWQERILEALEKAEESRGDPRGRDDRDKRDRQSLSAPNGRDPGANAAAAKAQSRYGGRALAVVRTSDGYRVRLLLDDGRVTTVDIPD